MKVFKIKNLVILRLGQPNSSFVILGICIENLFLFGDIVVADIYITFIL